VKKYMIRSDVEGVSGVVSFDQAEPGKPGYAFGREMLKSDLTALLDGMIQGGADEIVIYDEHCDGSNIDPDWLPPRVSAIRGKPPYRADWAGGLDESFAGVILLGFHSRYGTAGGLLHHSYELDIRELRLNGIPVGEIGMEAAIAGDFGVPVLLVTGDSAGTAEAEALLPGVTTVAVKDSLSETSGRCLEPSLTRESIHEAAGGVVRDPPVVGPYRVGPPVELEIELNDGPYLVAVKRLFAAEITDARTLLCRADSVTAAWAGYWKKKLAAQDEEQKDRA